MLLISARSGDRAVFCHGRVAEVVEISEGGVGSEGLAKEEPTPWRKLPQLRRPQHQAVLAATGSILWKTRCVARCARSSSSSWRRNSRRLLAGVDTREVGAPRAIATAIATGGWTRRSGRWCWRCRGGG